MATRTHFAAIDQNGVVIDTRTSASRHAEGKGRFGLYTAAIVRHDRIVTKNADGSEAVTWQAGVISYHGEGNANDGLRQANIGTVYCYDVKNHTWREVNGKWITLKPEDQETVRIVTFARAEIVRVIVTSKKAKIGETVIITDYDKREGIAL